MNHSNNNNNTMSSLIISSNFLVPLCESTLIYGVPPPICTPHELTETVNKTYVDGEVVDTITALKALPKTGNTKAFTRGYYSVNDGGAAAYIYDPTDTTSADNGGNIIVASDGGRWKLMHSNKVDVKQWGARGDGVTDDSANFQAALNSLSAGGVVTVSYGRYYIGKSIIIPSNCTLIGPHGNVGTPQNNASSKYELVGGALLLNSAAVINMKGSSTLQGLLVHRFGMVFPAPDTTGYAGTAVKISTVDDVCVTKCMFLGFTQAISTVTSQRMRFTDVQIDCINGIKIENCYDISRLENVHCWPFATIGPGVPTINFIRSGNAFWFAGANDWGKATDCFSYGYARGFYLQGPSCMVLMGCAADTVPGNNTIGFEVTPSPSNSGGGDNSLIGCQAAGHKVAFVINTQANAVTRLTDCSSWTCVDSHIRVDSGDVMISGCSLRRAPSGIVVNNATSRVLIDRNRFYDMSGRPVLINAATSLVTITDSNDYGNFALPITNGSTQSMTPRTLVSAEPLVVPPTGSFFVVTGNTSFSKLNGGWTNRQIILKFSGVLTVSDGASMKLAGNFVTSADDTLTLIHDGTTWVELSRSAN